MAEGSAVCSVPGVGHTASGQPSPGRNGTASAKPRLAVVKAGGWECTVGIRCKDILLPLTCSVTHPGELIQEGQEDAASLAGWKCHSCPREVLTYPCDAAGGNGEPEFHSVQQCIELGGTLVWGAKVDKWKISLFPAFPFLFLQAQQNQRGQGSQHVCAALMILFYSPGVL